MTTLPFIVLGAALGAPLRYLADRAVQARHDSLFPWGTFSVNVAGSLLLGFVAALPTNEVLMAAVGTGFCGALTTYSTFGYETLRLAQDGARFYAVANVVASMVAGLGAGTVGFIIAQAIIR